jgi:hypothetical protein
MRAGPKGAGRKEAGQVNRSLITHRLNQAVRVLKKVTGSPDDEISRRDKLMYIWAVTSGLESIVKQICATYAE